MGRRQTSVKRHLKKIPRPSTQSVGIDSIRSDHHGRSQPAENTHASHSVTKIRVRLTHKLRGKESAKGITMLSRGAQGKGNSPLRDKESAKGITMLSRGTQGKGCYMLRGKESTKIPTQLPRGAYPTVCLRFVTEKCHKCFRSRHEDQYRPCTCASWQNLASEHRDETLCMRLAVYQSPLGIEELRNARRCLRMADCRTAVLDCSTSKLPRGTQGKGNSPLRDKESAKGITITMLPRGAQGKGNSPLRDKESAKGITMLPRGAQGKGNSPLRGKESAKGITIAKGITMLSRGTQGKGCSMLRGKESTKIPTQLPRGAYPTVCLCFVTKRTHLREETRTISLKNAHPEGSAHNITEERTFEKKRVQYH